MKKKFMAIALLQTLFCIAQTNTDLRPQVKSPEVNKFEQYMNMPVNLVSGTPQVSIPIYTVEYGGMSLPITLEYDASGVKVESIASCVGQNWSLNVGGVVSRIVKGAPDEGNPYTTFAWPQVQSFNCNGYYKDYGLTNLELGLNNYPAFNYSGCGDPRIGRYNIFSFFCSEIPKGNVDTQPDLFYFSTPQGGSKFVFNNQRQIVYLENTDFIIKENFVPNDFKTWLVTTPSGVKYKYGSDLAQPLGLNNAAERSCIGGVGELVSNYLINSWFLTEISNTNNNNKIQINYTDNFYKQIMNKNPTNFSRTNHSYPNDLIPMNEEQTYNNYVSSFLPTTIQNNVDSKLINNITAGDTRVNFIYSTRDDLSQLSPNYSPPKKLDEIQIFYKEQCIKKFTFNITTSNSNDNNVSNKRLILNNLIETSCNTPKIEKPYTFIYNATLMPDRLSYAQDKWGYYNGKDANRTPFSSYLFFGEQEGYSNKSVDFNYAKAMSLEKIIYPTKGMVEFEFEPHQATEPTDILYNPIPNQIIISDLQPQSNNGANGGSTFYNYTFTYNLDSTQLLSLSTNLMYPNPFHTLGTFCNGANASTAVEIIDTITGTRVAYIDYSEGHFNSTTTRSSIIKYYDSSNFVFGRRYDVKLYGTECYHNMAKIGIHNYTSIYDVGGLRIKKITHKNYDGAIGKENNYSYSEPNVIVNPISCTKLYYSLYNSIETLSGIISNSNINYLQKYLFDVLHTPSCGGINPSWGNGYLYYITVGTDLYDINFKGPQISYGTVIETDGNGTTTNVFGRYKSYFELNGFAIPKSIPWIPKFQSILAGDKLATFHKDSSGNIVKHNYNDYNYSLVNTTVKGIIGNMFPQITSYPLLSYTLQGQTKTLKTETETTNLNNNIISTTKEYEYNGNGHNQPTKITTTDNQGNQSLITNFTYPLDVVSPSPIISKLIAENRKTSPITTKSYRGAEKLSEQTTEYGNFQSDLAGVLLTLPKFVYTKKGEVTSNPLEKKVTYNYDTKGNLIEYTPENGVPTAIIWGYNKSQPIAKIENCAYSSIPAATITNLQTLSDTAGSEAALITALNALRVSLPQAMVTTYTHKPLIGISTITDPKGDTVTYHYDSFGRLQKVTDKNGNILTENEYNYKP
jgi:YD repeat-containing protein